MEHIRAERERFSTRLSEIPYLEPYPSQSNFVLCRVVGRDAAALKAALEREGILIRYYRIARLADHVRFTIGTPEQMEQVIEVLKSL